jgi:hypothetical protein
MSLFHPPMNMTCDIVAFSRNRHGDWVQGISVSSICHFREISTVRRTVNMEIDDSDAMIWLPADTIVEVGQIVAFDGRYYEIQRHTKARRLSDPTPQFVKCDLKITTLVS